ncbi:MAG: hypothetical protein ACTMUB_04360 [cyanobacterium endosymbiont of Rhopalodia musculus]|uniref:hypothetical protein n=1 Tax=cyanobacterium endosymbiont of Epithemia clementina EcSB TaxID=3034674 RepID=UPI002480A3AF|nr:hypothetical protein [cyanobacterium endosymbiont of Epithemia clementina EcSB]WGT67412.1 hypothetical protein P3F56_09475 [cyanobacterium endosymbiont of Epithemia clementina EcSB]
MKDFNSVKKLIETSQVVVLSSKTFGRINECYFRVAYGLLRPAMAKEGIEGLK